MSKPFVAALTGSIGSGKSSAARAFKSLGAVLIDADELAREAAAPGTSGLAEIKASFGEDVLGEDGGLNRRKLREIIFRDQAKRSLLENILHPKIRDLFLTRLSSIDIKTRPIVIYEVPLYFESRFTYPEISSVIVVSAPREVCIERIMRRDQSTRESADAALGAQLPIEYKTERADFILTNTGSLEELTSAATKTLDLLKLRANKFYDKN